MSSGDSARGYLKRLEAREAKHRADEEQVKHTAITNANLAAANNENALLKQQLLQTELLQKQNNALSTQMVSVLQENAQVMAHSAMVAMMKDQLAQALKECLATKDQPCNPDKFAGLVSEIDWDY